MPQFFWAAVKKNVIENMIVDEMSLVKLASYTNFTEKRIAIIETVTLDFQYSRLFFKYAIETSKIGHP